MKKKLDFMLNSEVEEESQVINSNKMGEIYITEEWEERNDRIQDRQSMAMEEPVRLSGRLCSRMWMGRKTSTWEKKMSSWFYLVLASFKKILSHDLCSSSWLGVITLVYERYIRLDWTDRHLLGWWKSSIQWNISSTGGQAKGERM